MATSTQIVSIGRLQSLTGTIAIVDGDAVLTIRSAVTRTLVRWLMTTNRGAWEIEAQQSTTIPPAS